VYRDLAFYILSATRASVVCTMNHLWSMVLPMNNHTPLQITNRSQFVQGWLKRSPVKPRINFNLGNG